LLDQALLNAGRSVLVGVTQNAMTPSTAAQVETDFRNLICNGSFFYKSSCSEIKIQVLIGPTEINANRDFRAPINEATSPPTITIPASQSFNPLPGPSEDVVIRVYAPAKTIIARLNGFGVRMASGDSVLISATAFKVEPFRP
jgi:hypothetical protein